MIAVMLMPMEITAPNIEYGLLAPVLLIFAGACVGVLAEAVAPREIRRVVQLVITFVSLAAALATTLLNWASGAQAVVVTRRPAYNVRNGACRCSTRNGLRVVSARLLHRDNRKCTARLESTGPRKL